MHPVAKRHISHKYVYRLGGHTFMSIAHTHMINIKHTYRLTSGSSVNAMRTI